MASNALECDICRNTFAEENTPRILPCSHTFCGPCIDKIIAAKKKTCPNCREPFTNASAEELMVNRSLLDVVEQLSSKCVNPKTLSRRPKGIFLRLTNDFLESDKQILQSGKILKEMKDVWEAIEFFKRMKSGVLDTNGEIERSVEEMKNIKLSNKNIVSVIDRNIRWLKRRMIRIVHEEGNAQDGDSELESIDSELESIDSSSTGSVMEEEEEVLRDGQEKINKIQKLLRENEKKKEDCVEDIINMKRQIGNVAEDIKNAIEGDLLAFRAAKMMEGKQMVAQVRVNPIHQVRLSHFAEGDVRPDSLVIAHESLMDTTSRRAFLDLAADGTILGRIVIKLMDESNLALNFLHLCLGDLGPCYANSPVLTVRNQGRYGESIVLGGYRRGNYTEEGSVITGVDWNDEEMRDIYKNTSHKAGELRASCSYVSASKFSIVTRDNYNWHSGGCFGTVEQGLDILMKVTSQYPDITPVKVVDCGLVFPEVGA